jgi:hypothetical protein
MVIEKSWQSKDMVHLRFAYILSHAQHGRRMQTQQTYTIPIQAQADTANTYNHETRPAGDAHLPLPPSTGVRAVLRLGHGRRRAALQL